MNQDNNDNPLNKKSEPKDVVGGTARIRTQSECSAASDAGSGTSTGKRQRTTSQQFMVTSGLTSASPPKFVSLEEIMQAANGIRDMALVHQIVVDDDFKLEPFEPADNSVQKVIKDTMHRAFFDLLRSELDEDPPNYRQALVLLEDIKQGLSAVLLPQHTKIKQQISEILDTQLIKQQAEKGTLDFHHYAQYVISVMAKLCAPIRDDKIKELTEMSDVIDTFKGILQLLDLMQLDMANFTIQIARPDIIACSVELERQKFADYLAITADGLQYTRKWLLKHLDASKEMVQNHDDHDSYMRNVMKKTFTAACIDLLEWDDKDPYPETFTLDETRLKALQILMNRLITIGTVLLVTVSSINADLQSIAAFKLSLKAHIAILLESVNSEEDLYDILPNVAEQVIKDVKEAHKKYHLSDLNDTAEKMLKERILDVSNPGHKIRQLIRQRVKEFLQEMLESSTAAPQKVPSGLTTLQKELILIAGQFLKIVSHNSTVFCIYYFDIVSAALPKPA